MDNPLNKEEERNWLAQLRTLMANERTLMAYYRTSFAIIGVAAFILKFYEDILLDIVAGVLIFFGALLAAYGSVRHKKFVRKIKNNNKSN